MQNVVTKLRSEVRFNEARQPRFSSLRDNPLNLKPKGDFANFNLQFAFTIQVSRSLHG